jgi:hypothetical protein
VVDINNGVRSIHELDPLESGGTAARQGFLFQDHVAAGFCLELLVSGRLKSVWCETLDDVTLISEDGEAEVVEFVQVKAERLDQLWSPARLCAREGKRAGSSVLERLLANDRCEESCRFRMVTYRPVVEELLVLEAELGTEVRKQASERMKSLCEKLEEHLEGAKSPNGHGPTWWAEHTVWEIRHSEESLRDRNLNLLARAVDTSGRFLASDQREQLYEFLLMKVKAAADADKSLNRDAGKLKCDALMDWFEEKVRQLDRGGSNAGGRDLRAKLEAAGLPGDIVDSAEELRRSYLSRWLRPSYLERSVAREWEDRVRAELVALRSRLDSGTIDEPGVQFHNRTIAALEGILGEAATERALSKDFVLGCMYYITDLCQHRFLRAEL